MDNFYGLPPLIGHDKIPPGFDMLGHDCRIAESVTIFRDAARNEGPRGVKLGDQVILMERVRLVLGDMRVNVHADISIGSRVIVNAGAYLSGEGGLVIEDEVLIGPGAKILSAGHDFDGKPDSIYSHPLTYGRIRIGKGAWIGAGAIVLEGTTIGEGAVVGAGCVVNRAVSPYSVVVGNPARFLKWRKGYEPTDTKRNLFYRICGWLRKW